ncbi:Gti1/Pac2 family-domain-containing protein [Mycena pura]|uniref:Gti1/Pac2 family-domain-containing protein n=1 Tax=Mycena pura TaxID=153505 RepID=A0AAD6V5I5_9AGAR|nr:Gti1/Pac2 family-domain-containing protein [Mycena pura]KAJ7197788.1 Gti1/Pac2 family-domain-containing protein [Mycena pura]
MPHISNITHPSLHIRNVNDVFVVLEAVRRGILPLITLRLSVSESGQLESGNIFVWQESTRGGGLVRWTDGRRWSQSKVCADCLFYEEKVEFSAEEREAKATRRIQKICNPGTTISPPARNQRPSKTGGLTKRAYSFLVRLPGSRKARKWHVVAYTLWTERASLPVIEDYPELRNIRVPLGVFARCDGSSTFAPSFAAPSIRSLTTQGRGREVSGWRVRNITSTAPLLHIRSPPPYYHCSESAEGSRLPLIRPGSDDRKGLVLPPISKLLLACGQNPAQTPSQLQLPVSDRRILNSFRSRL